MIFQILFSLPFWFAGGFLLWLIFLDFKKHRLRAFTESPIFEAVAIWMGLFLIAIAARICGIA